LAILSDLGAHFDFTLGFAGLHVDGRLLILFLIVMWFCCFPSANMTEEKKSEVKRPLIFISYAHSSFDAAKEIADALVAHAGFDVAYEGELAKTASSLNQAIARNIDKVCAV
jgi:hypothetical protein